MAKSYGSPAAVDDPTVNTEDLPKTLVIQCLFHPGNSNEKFEH